MLVVVVVVASDDVAVRFALVHLLANEWLLTVEPFGRQNPFDALTISRAIVAVLHFVAYSLAAISLSRPSWSSPSMAR